MKNRGWAKYWGDWLKTGFITAFFGFSTSQIAQCIFAD